MSVYGRVLCEPEESLDSGVPPNAVWKLDGDAKPDSGDFPGKFFLVVLIDGAPQPPPYEVVAEELNRAIKSLDGARFTDDPVRDSKLKQLLVSQSQKLWALADYFVTRTEPIDEFEIIKRIGELGGRYSERRNHILAPELVDLIPPELPARLVFRRLDTDASSELQKLLLGVRQASSVVDVVLERKVHRRGLIARALRAIGPCAPPPAQAVPEIANARAVYLRELKDIADEGLASPEYAQRRLEAFRGAFVDREADAVKNQHVRELGLWALSFSSVLLLLALLTAAFGRSLGIQTGHERAVENFLLLAAAACGGTWLSFSLRKVVLAFGDLAVLEEDRLDPAGRLVFVVLLTLLLGLLIETGSVAFSVGGKAITVTPDPLMAIVFGAMCGIAERSLSRTVSGHAEKFTGGVGPSGPGAKTEE
jgi:hypothetical protein